MAIPLGPFQLDHPVGRGGMGIVWLGRHRSQGVPVAVKVITAKAASTEEYHRAFQQEVRAVSALDHPGVVWIFDAGTIPAESAAASQGELVAGSPFLVMEYASHGTLRQQTRLLPWADVRTILLALFDALAHAHARGVLHRDLKPDNILIAGSGDLRPGIKITDFGIARPLDDVGASEDRPVGTPQYMAPEQIRNDVHQYGPHTDLYALGNLAWRMVTGRVPFHGAKGAQLMYAQLHREPPRLQPAIAVPSGIEEFLRALLAKEPHRRFQRAADAALALASLPDPGGGAGEPVITVEPANPGDRDRDKLDLDTATLKVVVNRGKGAGPALDPALRPPFPATWRLPPTASRPLRLMGAGLGLYGTRPVPLVGREAERDRLWKQLFDVHHEQRARVALVRGAPGVGRSRLVHWVADRAHEVGGATVLKIGFTHADSAIEQIRRSLVRLLQTHPMSPEVRDQRFGKLFAGKHVSKLTVVDAIDLLLQPSEEGGGLPDEERQTLLRRIFELLARDRPLLVVFDDAQWGPESLKLAHHLLAAQHSAPHPVMVVLTVRDDPDAHRHAEVKRLVESLAEQPNVEQIALEPLVGEARVDLVLELLGFDLALADEVAERTAGSPLFAVQLVADWVERGMLAAGPTGFVLANPDVAMPSTLAEVWEDRIRALVGGLDAPALQILETAAVLGREVDALEWQAVCDDPEGRHAAIGRAYLVPRHARLRQALMDRLLARKLARATDVGFAFDHALFRDALLQRARNAGRFREHAAAAAAVLQHRAGEADLERVGRLLAASGELEAAVAMLLRAEVHRRRTAGMVAALDLLGTIERALRRGRAPRSHRGWAELACRRATALAALQRMPEAEREARVAHQRASAGAWRALRAEAASVLGEVAEAAEDLVAAEAHWSEAADLLGDDGDVVASVRAWNRLRRIAERQGDAAGALDRGERLRGLLARARGEHERTYALLAMADHLRAVGAPDEAAAHATEATALATASSDLRAEIRGRALLAEIAESRNDLGPARDEWYRSVTLLDLLGADRDAVMARCRLALVLCRSGHDGAARDGLEPLLAQRQLTDPVQRAGVHAVLALSAAGLARWERFDAHIQVCEAVYPSLRAPEVHFADVMALAADRAMSRGQRERALRALALAEGRYRSLGLVEPANTMLFRIDQLDATEAGGESGAVSGGNGEPPG
ncbi:MAG: protein kinase [Myxococcota bacterium]